MSSFGKNYFLTLEDAKFLAWHVMSSGWGWHDEWCSDMMNGVADKMSDTANMMQGVADLMAEWGMVGRPGSVSTLPPPLYGKNKLL